LLAVTASFYLSGVFGSEAASFWKRGSFRSGSNIGSSRSSAGVSGRREGSGPSYGVDNSFCNSAMARSGSPMRATTRARMSTNRDPPSHPSRSDSRPWPVPTEHPDEILTRSAQFERIDTIARRTFGLNEAPSGQGSLTLSVLTNHAVVQVKAQSVPRLTNLGEEEQ